jgi:hypothetical protein
VNIVGKEVTKQPIAGKRTVVRNLLVVKAEQRAVSLPAPATTVRRLVIKKPQCFKKKKEHRG